MIFLKIKEVIDKTGLTDRAIRLYIEHGLVAPENQRSYTGRNNYEFTQEDIDCLEQIAMLRKADFSLEQIKILMAGGESARTVLCEYLTAKKESVAIGQKIVEALTDFPEQEPVTAESVCRKIKERIEQTPLPDADMKPTKAEKAEKWLMRIPAIIFLAFWGLSGIGVWLTYRDDFVFPRFYTHPMHYIGIAYIIIPVMAAITVLVQYRKNAFLPKKRKKRRWITGISLTIALFVCIQPMGPVFLAYCPPVYSETDYPGNYLVLGLYAKMYGDVIYKLFPANIPRCAVAEDSMFYPPDRFLDTTKYYYYFQEVIDPIFHIYAEWVLPEDEFAEELKRIRNYYPEDARQQVQWGDWICLSFTDDTLDFEKAKEETHFYYLLFAYNEKTYAVRYIASKSIDTGRVDDPYFLMLQWE